MDIFVIVIDILLALVAWTQFSKLWDLHLAKLLPRVDIKANFWQDFGKVIFLSSAAVSSENIPTLIQEKRWVDRSRELFVAASSISFFSIFVFSVVLSYFVSTIFGLGFAILTFCIGFYFVYNKHLGWSKFPSSLGTAVLWLGVFVVCVQSFGKELAKLTYAEQPPEWIFFLTNSFLKGAAFGFIFSLILRKIFKKSGAVSWIGFQSVFVGVMSIGMGWGIILGDLISGYTGELKFKQNGRQLRAAISTIIGLVFVVFSAEYQIMMENVFGGLGGSIARYMMLVTMVLIYCAVDLGICMTVFHFRHQLAQKTL